MAESAKTIGGMNGPWALLLRLTLATYPMIVAWAIWMTANQFEDNAWRGLGPRYTGHMADIDKTAVMNELRLELQRADSQLQIQLASIEQQLKAISRKLGEAP